MPEPIFEHERLVEIYDTFDGERTDLQFYLDVLKEKKVQSVLDIGCGTGCLATLLAAEGFKVTGVDPARGSLEVAKRKPHAERVHWILGEVSHVSTSAVDAAVMTGNVAQVFLTDSSWTTTLSRIRKVLKPNGFLVFEARDPSKRAWTDWTPVKTSLKKTMPTIGEVEGWCEVLEVNNQLVTFRWTYVFASDGQILTSDSTLRFRERQEIEDSLAQSGFVLEEVRDAPDRPGKEFIFIATTRA
jgi:ubiquinone/menaquinone biosynthesis C-methylase UbiE